MKVIYLHGFASGPGSKKAQFFKRRFEEIGVDLTIPDLAEGNFEGLTITGQLAVVERLAEGRAVTLIGSSLGGYLSALYAARHPETGKLVLLAPGFGFPQRWPDTLGREKFEAWKRTGKMAVFHYGEKAERQLGWGLMEDAAKYESYPAVTQPCLIFHGRLDDVVPVSASREFAKDKPNVELHVEESDHELLNVVDAMWERVKTFLSQ